MKKILLSGVAALLLTTVSSCVDNLDDKYSINPKAPSEVSAGALMANAERDLARTITSASVNLNVFRLYVQYWAQTTYFDESVYDINTRSINTFFWRGLYRDVLRDLEEAKTLVQKDNLVDASAKTNQLAEIEVLEVYTWSVLVDTYGNIPYSQALDFNITQPKYDDAKTIYADLFRRLNGAIGKLDPDGDSFGDADIIMGGDVAHWQKFANSLKLRMAMRVADVSGFASADGKSAKVLAEEAVTAGVLTSNGDDVQLNFTPTFPSANPVWEDLVQSGRKDFVAANTFVDSLQSYNDPRIGQYFTTLKDSTGADIFLGGEYGTNNNYNSYSHVGSAITAPTAPGVMLSYAEVEFLLAEAAERGFGVSGSAESHYNAGVTASLEKWGASAADIAAYLAQPKVAYATAPGDFRQKIGIQKWFALYDEPVEAWAEWRRLDAPALVAPADALSAIPLRFPYPVNEQNLNTANYNAAAAAIGGDVVTTKIFWDTH